MPNWKKVIVSGSDAVLSAVTATAGLVVTGSALITGSLEIKGTFNQASASLASADFAHVQGFAVTASGIYSHAEGQATIALGSYSHAEGSGTRAVGASSHTEGYNTTASGDYSHAEGFNTVSSGSYQHVQGQYNISSSAQSAFIVGNGTSDAARSNLIFASGSQVQITGSVAVKGLGTTNSTTSLIVQNSGGAVLLRAYDNASIELGNTSNSNQKIVVSTNNTNEHSAQDGHQFLVVGPAASFTTAMYIKGASAEPKVGIRTTNPLFTLDVSGSGRFTGGLTVTGSALVSGSSTTTGTQIISGSLVFAQPTSPAFNGEIVRFGSGTLATGQLYFLSSSRTWSLANANSTGSSTGMLGIATGTSPTTDGLLVRGYAASSSYTTATGSIVYAATSSGLMTTTSPSSSNHVVRVVGYVTTSPNTIYFAPDPTFVTLA